MSQLPLVPGPDGSPIPGGVRLIRMANEPKVAHLNPEAVRRVSDGKALPLFFDLSSEDKKQPFPRLSVWVEELTSVAQAWVLVGASSARRWVVRLEVDKVRCIFASGVPQFPPTPTLDVHWERATQVTDAGDRVPETRPGWEGHAGIANLDNGNKTQRNSLRLQLADSADVQILRPEQLATLAEPETPQS
ncbi:MAG: hypothetical protein ACRCZF_23235 [Gemmataceae bacterium]